MKGFTAPAASVAEMSNNFYSFNFVLEDIYQEFVYIKPSDLITHDHKIQDSSPYQGSPSIFGKEACAMTCQTASTELWGLFDTGATHYMFNKLELFESSTMTSIPSENNELKLAGVSARLTVQSKGTVKLKAGDGSTFEFKNCLYIPNLSRHLIAGGLLLRKGIQIIIHPSNNKCFSLVFRNKALFNGIFLNNNLMLVNIILVSDIDSKSLENPEAQSTEIDSHLLHRRLGHVSHRYLQTMRNRGCVDGMKGVKLRNKLCEICAKSKGTKTPHSSSRPRAQRFLENIHVDLCGFIQTRGLKNEMYFILFCDNFSSSSPFFPLKDKAKESVYEVFKYYISLSEKQTGCRVKQFTMDRGSKFLNNLLGKEIRTLGITLHLTASHSPEENGVSERGNQTINTKARSMMLEASSPLMFWFEACRMAVFLTNQTITSALPEKITPFEKWHGRPPSIHNLKFWGCQAFSLIRKDVRESNFSQVSQEGVLVGFEDDNFNYHVYEFKTRKVIITHHATFN